MAAGAKTTYAAPAVEKAFEILEVLEDHPGGLLISEMAVRLDRTVGELFRIVVVMETLGYLQKSRANDRYSVSYKLLDLAIRATPAQDLVTAARGAMRTLAIVTGQSCHLVVINDIGGLVIAREQNPGTRGFSLRLGAAVDMIASCSGKTLLAFSTAETRDHVIAGAGDRTIDRATLDRQLAAIRKAGFEQRRSAITRGVTDLSVPIFGIDGSVAAALTIPFLDVIDGSQTVDLPAAREHLCAAAQEISQTLGAPPR